MSSVPLSEEDTTRWRIIDQNRKKVRHVDSRAEAEEEREKLIEIGATPEQIEVRSPKGEERANVTEHGDVVQQGGKSVDAEVVEMGEEHDLPDDPPVDTDPLTWIPDEFQDTIDGTVAINRKGFEVLAHHYDIAVTTEMVEYADEKVVHKAEATTRDGLVYTAWGEADSSEDDDTQLVRLSDTRAFKRAVSRATGIGMIAVEELRNSL